MTVKHDGKHVLTGEDFGAIRLINLNDLYEAQKSAVEGIIRGIHSIACTAFEEHGPAGTADDPAARRALQFLRAYERPHHCYVVDGVRGTGKTSALLTIRGLVEAMTLGPPDGTASRRDAQIEASLRSLGYKGPLITSAVDHKISDALRSLDLQRPSGAKGQERVALVLPVVFTEDMEPREAAMDAVFSLIQKHLDDEIVSQPNTERERQLKAIRDELQRKITSPWAYSCGLGQHALAQDALGYDDYIVRRADYNVKAYDRIRIWHEFLDRLLNALGRQLLVVLFDDTDLDQRAAEDILRAMRIYLSHPRVVSVLAVDMTTLVPAVTAQNLSRSSDILRALDRAGREEVIVNDIVRITEANSRALLDKVLPTPLRHRLSIDDLNFLKKFFPSDGEDPFGTWCRSRFQKNTDPLQKAVWWLLSGPYRRLVADNIRHVILFREQTRDLTASPLAAMTDYYKLRDLMVTLGGNLDQLKPLIENEVISASWPTGRGSSQETRGLYEEQFIDLCVDAQIVFRRLGLSISALARGWLPEPIGDGTAPALKDDKKRLGIAGMEASRLPRNCLFVHQYRRLSSLILRSLPDGSWWSARLGSFDIGQISRAAAELMVECKGSQETEILNKIGSRLDQVRSLVPNTRGAGPQIDNLFKSLVALAAASQAEARTCDGFLAVVARIAAGEDKDAANFVERLAEAVQHAERERQEALFTWSCALEIADMGDDNRTQRTDGPRKQLVVSIGATSTDFELRFRTLVTKTVERVEKGGRHALLLLWSLQPLLEILHGYGADYRRPEEGPSPAWSDLATMAVNVAIQEGLMPSDQGWTYIDMNDEVLPVIVADVMGLIRELPTRFSRVKAPGSIRLSGGWPDSPAKFLAALLITSENWVKENLLADRG